VSNFSYLGVKTIIFYEIKDYFKEFQFNVIAPLINTILFVFILSTIDKYYSFNSFTDSYINFLIPGMVMLVVFQTSYNHLSEVIISMKQIGSFNDYLISPISRIEIFLSFILSSIFVSLVVAFINLIALSFFTDFEKINYINLLYFLILSIIIFSSLGAITGFLSFTWDVQSSVSNFFIIPISFLSGTFFSIDQLDKELKLFFEYNPFYYLVKGFRSSFFYNRDISFCNELYLLILVITIFLFSLYIFKRGFRVIN